MNAKQRRNSELKLSTSVRLRF